MKSALTVLAAAVFLLGANAAQAAKSMSHGAPIIVPAQPVQTTPPTTNPGALSVPFRQSFTPGTLNPGLTTVPNQDGFGALPGEPGSPSYDPYGGLPSLDNSGSAVSPAPGTSGTGF